MVKVPFMRGLQFAFLVAATLFAASAEAKILITIDKAAQQMTVEVDGVPRWKRGHAIHGSYDTKRLGSAASHGCVRLHPANAAKLFALVERQGVTNATVVIAGAAPGAARPARRRTAPAEDNETPAEAQPFYRQAPSPYSPPQYEAPPADYYYRW
jgi:hypothetical protein